MILRIIAGSAIALGLGLMTESVRAAQTFLCEDGRVLQVELKNLERLKREDACVASHYGIKVKLVPLPVKRPARPVVGALKGSKKPAPPRREIGVVAASATSSFRNVRIINARGGGARWFQHRR
mgnify:FL=1